MDYDDICPKLTKEIKTFIQLHPDMKDKAELVIYAAAQVVHELLSELDDSEVFKGAIASDVLVSFRELNRENLALYHQQAEAIREQKDSTLH